MKNIQSARKFAALAIAGLLSLAGSASAATVNLGEIKLLPNTPNQVVAIEVQNGGNVQGAKFVGVVAGGGPDMTDYELPAGADGPNITTIDLLSAGTIFSTNNDGKNRDMDLTDQLKTSAARVASGTVNADGVLAYITFDTTNILSGSYPFDLAYPDADFSSLDGNAISFTPGTLTIQVPEPASLSMLALGGLALLRRRRR